jgi:hypothetical protein
MNGEHEEVWDEIRRLGPVPPALAPDVEAVAAETMRRVSRHVRRTINGVTDLGLAPAYPEFGPHLEPTDDDRRDLVQLDQQIGGLPAALRACMSVVGGVDLRGDCPPLDLYYHHPEWAETRVPIYPDPLYLPSIRRLRWEWNGHNEYPEPRDRPFWLCFAPDDIHKANISGSVQTLDLPSSVADPVIDGVRDQPGITLVEYLRLSVAWGGCPGWRFAPEHTPPKLQSLRATPDF